MDKPEYHRFCVWDGKPVPEDRLRRRSNTCCNECKTAERNASRAYFGWLRKEYLRPRILRQASRAHSAQTDLGAV